MKNINLSVLISFFFTSFLFGQSEQSDPKFRHSIGTNLFMLGNFTEESPEFVSLTYGYRLTPKDRVYAEFITWIYSEPQGEYGKGENYFPGFVRTYGLGLGYQRFLWKGLFGSVSATPFLTQYYGKDDEKIQKGFQLYTMVSLGYRFEFLNNRLYIEPAYALRNWPIDTNLPDEFQTIEDAAPKHIFEPSLNIGYRF